MGLEVIESDVDELDQLVTFLAPLDYSSGAREKSSSVTMSRWPQLHDHCSEDEKDSTMTKQLKLNLKNELQVMNIIQLVNKCKKLVTYLKLSGLDTDIDGHLKQEFEVRWNTHVELLTSLDKNWDKVRSAIIF